MSELKKVPGSVHLFAYYKGDWIQEIDIVSGGSAYDLTDATATFTIYEMNGTAALSLSTGGGGITHTSTGGVVTVTATNAQIVALSSQDYRYEFIVTISSGRVWPMLDGVFTITEDGTAAATGDSLTVSIENDTVTLTLPAGTIGATGPTGPAGGTAVTYTAGETLAAGRVVIIDGGEAFYFQPSDATHHGRAYGVTVSAASIGASASIQIGGEIENAAFTFGADSPLWVYNNGIIVDTVPAVSIVQSAGTAAAPNKMRINFSLSIKTD
jgi:hypothetical protein